MVPITNARVLYKKHPTTFPVPGETTILDTSLVIDVDAVPLNGGFLLKTLVLSSDPYLRSRMREPGIRSYTPEFTIGQPINNYGVSVVLRSENDEFPPGTFVYGFLSFQEYSVSDGTGILFPLIPLQKPKELKWSLFVGTLGLPGQSAYFAWKGLVEERAKKSKTLFISGGAGPVGTFAIQYAKLKQPGLKIIASAGTQEKLDLMASLGADVTINYRTEDTAAILEEHGPIDIYWDNVSGPTLDAALKNMAEYGLIVAFGAISAYNLEPQDIPPVRNFAELFQRSLTVRGFRFTDFIERYLPEFHAEIPTLVMEGKIKYHEQRYLGLENAEQALLDVHTGANFGKAVIVVSDDS